MFIKIKFKAMPILIYSKGAIPVSQTYLFYLVYQYRSTCHKLLKFDYLWR